MIGRREGQGGQTIVFVICLRGEGARGAHSGVFMNGGVGGGGGGWCRLRLAGSSQVKEWEGGGAGGSR